MQLYVLMFIFVAVATSCVSTEKATSVEPESAIPTIDNELVLQLLQRVHNLESHVHQLESQDKLQQAENDKLHSHVQFQQKRTKWLEGIVQRLQQKSRKQNAHVANGNTNDNTHNQNVENESSFQNSNSNRREVDNQKQRRADESSSIGFLATLGGHLTHMGVNQDIVFENVVTNVGHAYNGHNGGFIAPVSGLYAFSATLVSLRSDSHFEFIKNGSPVSKMYIRGLESAYSTSSQTWCLDLSSGDDVAIRNIDTDEALLGSNYSSFTGFLLHQNYQDSGTIVGK